MHFFFLRPLLDLHGADLLADKLLHVVVPVLAVAAWLGWGPRGQARLGELGRFLVLPVVWIGYTLVRGAFVSWYPYPFIDVDEHGYGVVLLNCLGVAALVLALFACASWLDRRLHALAPGRGMPRRAGPARRSLASARPRSRRPRAKPASTSSRPLAQAVSCSARSSARGAVGRGRRGCLGAGPPMPRSTRPASTAPAPQRSSTAGRSEPSGHRSPAATTATDRRPRPSRRASHGATASRVAQRGRDHRRAAVRQGVADARPVGRGQHDAVDPARSRAGWPGTGWDAAPADPRVARPPGPRRAPRRTPRRRRRRATRYG